MEINPSSSSRTDRKTIERNRRNQMKDLYSKLNSLVPHHSSREPLPITDQLDKAANYIKKLQIKLERMKEKKDSLMSIERPNNASVSSNITETPMQLKDPIIEVHEIGSALEVVLITGLDGQLMFNETIRVLHEEGAEIVHASFSVLNDTVYHSIHSKVENSVTGNGSAARISERLKNFIQESKSYTDE
ncbi:transcription factor bHLH162 [Mercurialis annua]|uniref:transcription factor bHLH162 n=1 Tax=Mercurialis annua TaxID=3986 RepID=UPI00215EB620|nr:transcription factor bHLH162 [Mercurialis annua]